MKFDYATNTFIGPLMMDCSGFTACVMHVMGDSPADKPYTQEQYAGSKNGYKFSDKYKPQSTDKLGPSNQGNNATLFNFSEGKVVSKTDIVKMFDSNDTAGLKKLEGKYFYWNSAPSPYTDFTTYTHTGLMGPYDPVTKTIIVYDSNQVRGQDGPGARKLTLKEIKDLPHFDILELNK